MPTKLGISISNTAFALAQQGKLDVDYVVWYGQLLSSRLPELLALKPALIHDLPEPFWLNYEAPFTEEMLHEGQALMDLARPPWFSTGVGASAEPQAHRDGPYREGNADDLQTREVVVANITRHTKRLREWLKIPVALENFNYHPTNAYEYICEPELFSQLLDATGCDMLLDLAHAQISAHNMKWPGIHEYLMAMPLHKVREIHFTRPGWQGDQRVDLHQPVEADDIALLGWTLDHTPDPWVTLEVGEMPEAQMIEQLAALRRFLAERDKAKSKTNV